MEIAAIYTEFQKSLLAYIRSKIRSKEDAEDILQNVFIKISGNVNQLTHHEKLKSWVFTITRNAIIDYYREHTPHKNLPLDESHFQEVLEEESMDTTKGLEQCIQSMIDLLPVEYQQIVVDAELKGVKQKDMAIKYQMPYSSMRSRVQRGREKLRQLFHNCCRIETDRFGNVLQTQAGSGSNCSSPCSPNIEE